MNLCEISGRCWPEELLYGEYRKRPDVLVRQVDEFRERLEPYRRAWARHGIHFSLSPWRSPSWIGLLYSRVYGSAADFARNALEEYAQCFTTGFFELGPYHLPAASSLLQATHQVPPGFGFVVTVTHDLTLYRFPYGHPDIAKRGALNQSFLNAGVMCDSVVPALQMLEPHLRVVVVQIGQIYTTEEFAFPAFLKHLDGFLGRLPGTYRYAVGLRNPEYLLPEYFACLHRHNAAHVLCHCTTMPLLDQIQRPDILTSDIVVLRTDDEVEGFPVRRRRRQMDVELRLGILETVRRCVSEKKTLYVDLCDRSGGVGPLSLLSLMALLDADLAKLSPLKKRAA
jgi:uncharacterized protein YecE (DUF72 family)